MARKILKVIGIIVLVVGVSYGAYKIFLSGSTTENTTYVVIQKNGIEVRVESKEYKRYSEDFCANIYEHDCDVVKEIDQKRQKNILISDEETAIFNEYASLLDDYIFDDKTK